MADWTLQVDQAPGEVSLSLSAPFTLIGVLEP